MITRRTALLGSVATLGVVGFSLARMSSGAAQPGEVFEVTHTEEEWRALLTPAQFAVLRQEVTEPAFSNTLLGETSPLLHEERAGTFYCAGCDLAVYPSSTKYDSGTGWPSFWDALPDAIGTSTDYILLYPRTEIHCRRCGGHFGHMFVDGPPPTGMRHCLNGLALTFQPTA